MHAGGDYINRPRHNQAFVVSEVNGTWGRARRVARALNTGANAQIFTVSCGSAGNCSAGGYYSQAHSMQEVIVVNKS